ncbi:MAG: hypothetical protein MR727_07025 [Lentisphaeria bacterium]|nr:hypothetical protein [Lentisphaeria bacterium]
MQQNKKNKVSFSVKVCQGNSLPSKESREMRRIGLEASAAAVKRSYQSAGYISYLENGVVVRKYADGRIVPVSAER